MLQVARNLTDAEEGFLRGEKHLLMDRDAKFSEAFRVILEQAGVKAVRLPPRSPNLNPHLDWFPPGCCRQRSRHSVDSNDRREAQLPQVRVSSPNGDFIS